MKEGLTPKGEAMPQTLSEWKYLAELYGKGLDIEKRENSLLRADLNKLKQKMSQLLANKAKFLKTLR